MKWGVGDDVGVDEPAVQPVRTRSKVSSATGVARRAAVGGTAKVSQMIDRRATDRSTGDQPWSCPLGRPAGRTRTLDCWSVSQPQVPGGFMSVASGAASTTAANSVWPQLEQLLPQVSKPIQYVGGELGAVVKDWASATVRWALMYPDAYEVGLPNQGVQILYEVLNELPDVLAERTYAVWPDLEKLMRAAGRAAVHRRGAPAGGRFRPVRRLLRHRTGLHQPAHRHRPGWDPAARGRPYRRRPGDRGRWTRRVQPGADRRFHRRGGAR